MSDDIPNRIRVSFDQNMAVRDDGARLVAVQSRGMWAECGRCAACNPGNYFHDCNVPEAKKFRFCTGNARKDRRDIYWSPCNERPA